MVTVCDPTRPMRRPNRPARTAPASGASTTQSRTDFEIANSTPGIGSALQRIDLGDVDRSPVAEHRDQDRQADRGLGGGHREDEEHEDLPGGIAQLARERDEVDVDREQHQLDRHQQDDHVLPVEEDAGHGDAEQRRAEREVVAEGELRDHGFASSSTGACGVGRTACIFTMRNRSPERTRACCDGSWCLTPVRRRRVSITAATTAMVRITAATSNGSMKSVNSARASHVVLDTSAATAASAASGVALIALTPISARISSSITTATSSPIGRWRTKPSRKGATSMSSIITTNRNSTITAPT